MATVTLSTGTSVAVASVYAAVKSMTAISNATEAVATLEASHGVVVNDILEVISGWGRLDKRVVRASAVATNDVTFDDINTTSTTFFPAGQGTGSVREISTWVSLNGIREVAFAGGETQFADVTTLEDVIQKQIPTVESPSTFTFTMLDDTTQGYVAVVTTASDAKALMAIRFTLPSGSIIYGTGYWAIQRTPTIALNSPLTTNLTFTLANLVTRY